MEPLKTLLARSMRKLDRKHLTLRERNQAIRAALRQRLIRFGIIRRALR